jgi:hypothetical protein
LPLPALVFAQTIKLSGLRPNFAAAAETVDKSRQSKVTQTPPSQEIREDDGNPCWVEGEELGVRHFARRHGEFAVRATRNIASDPQVVGLVGQDKTGRDIAFEQSSKNRGVGRVAVRHDRGIVVLIALVALIQVCGDLLARSVDHR